MAAKTESAIDRNSETMSDSARWALLGKILKGIGIFDIFCGIAFGVAGSHVLNLGPNTASTWPIIGAIMGAGGVVLWLVGRRYTDQSK